MMDEMLDYFKVHLEKYPNDIFMGNKDKPEEIITQSKKRG